MQIFHINNTQEKQFDKGVNYLLRKNERIFICISKKNEGICTLHKIMYIFSTNNCIFYYISGTNILISDERQQACQLSTEKQKNPKNLDFTRFLRLLLLQGQKDSNPRHLVLETKATFFKPSIYAGSRTFGQKLCHQLCQMIFLYFG